MLTQMQFMGRGSTCVGGPDQEIRGRLCMAVGRGVGACVFLAFRGGGSRAREILGALGDPKILLLVCL